MGALVLVAACGKSETKPPPMPTETVMVSAAELQAAFAENGVAAKDKYALGKLAIRVSGIVEEVGTNKVGAMTVRIGNAGGTVTAIFGKGEKENVMKLKSGVGATVVCLQAEQLSGVVVLNGCTVAE